MENKDILRILNNEVDFVNRNLWKYNIVMAIVTGCMFVFLYACIALVDHRLMILASAVLNNARK